MKKRIATLISLPILALGACSVETSQTIDNDNAASTPPEGADSIKMGEKAVSNGIEIIVQGVEESPTLALHADLARRGEKPDEITEAKQSGKFVTTTTNLTNGTQEPMNPGCGGDIEVSLIDQNGRRYDPIRDSDRVKNTLECGDTLNPGFSTPMTWAFEVPQDAEPKFFRFSHWHNDPDDYTDVELEKGSADSAIQEGNEDSTANGDKPSRTLSAA